jgi:hypothetical protein
MQKSMYLRWLSVRLSVGGYLESTMVNTDVRILPTEVMSRLTDCDVLLSVSGTSEKMSNVFYEQQAPDRGAFGTGSSGSILITHDSAHDAAIGTVGTFAGDGVGLVALV